MVAELCTFVGLSLEDASPWRHGCSKRSGLKRLTAGLFLLIFLITWALCLPWLATKLAWIAGKHGYGPSALLIHIGLLFCAVTFVITVVGIATHQLTFKSAFTLGWILWLLVASWSVVTIQRMAVSGELLKEYCRGFSETVKSSIDVAGLNVFFSTVLQADEEDRLLYPLDPQSPLKGILPGWPPSVFVSRDSSVNVLWSCLGGGFGLIYSDAPPPEYVWLDESIPLGDRIWVVTRGE